VITRSLVIITFGAAALLGAGCSNLPIGSGVGLTTGSIGSLQIVGDAQASPAELTAAGQDEREAMKKTQASRVLAAMALERVTGRRPDPGRLAEAN
jgi:hypothetical protein